MKRFFLLLFLLCSLPADGVAAVPVSAVKSTLLEQSPKSYANAEFSSAEGSRADVTITSTLLEQSPKSYANAEFSSAEGSRADEPRLDSSGGAAVPVTLQLQWKHQFQFAGYYMAKEKGFYKEAGLDVTFLEYSDKTDAVSDVVSGKTAFATGCSSLILQSDKDLLLLAAIFQSSPFVLQSLKRGDIRSLKDIKGKKVMVSSLMADMASIMAMLKSEGISKYDFTLIRHTFTPEELIDGKADFISAYLSNEPFVLKERGYASSIFNPRDYGFDFYGDMLYTSHKFARSHPDLVENFYKASIMGWQYAFAHIDETVSVILRKYNTLHKSESALRYEAKVLKKLAYKKGVPLGHIDPIRLREIANTYRLLGINSATESALDDMIYRPKGTHGILLDTREKSYLLRKNGLKLCVASDWMPFEKYANTLYGGLGMDLAKEIGRLIGVPISFVPSGSLSERNRALERGRCDFCVLFPETAVEEEKKAVRLTDRLFSFTPAIATRMDEPYITDLKYHGSGKIALLQGSGMKAWFHKRYPQFRIVEVKHTAEGMRLLARGAVFGYVGLLPVLNYEIRKYYLGTVKINRTLEDTVSLGCAVRKGDERLYRILQKAVHTIDAEQRDEMVEEWIHRRVPELSDHKLLWRWLGVFGLVVLLLFHAYLATVKKNKELTLSLLELEILMESTMEGILIFDKEGYCMRTNRIASALFGYPHHEMIGKHASEFISSSSRELVRAKMRVADQAPYEARVMRKDGSEFDAILKGKNIFWKGEQIRLSTIIDISDMKRLQYDLQSLNAQLEKRVREQVEDIRRKDQMLLQQSKLASMGEMIGAIAHQWRQPLNMLNINIQNLDDDYEEGLIDRAFIAAFIEENSKVIRFMSKTIDDFRNFYRIDKVKECFFVRESIEMTISIQKAQLRYRKIGIRIVGEDFCVTGYRREFQQVILNLINNAADAIRRSRREDGMIEIVLEKERVSVKDNGGGVPKHLSERIFEPYFTTKSQGEGTGLGLYMSKVIIEKNMGGRLEVENSAEGAVFTIYLEGLCEPVTGTIDRCKKSMHAAVSA
ncbi:MAG: hypothetical protein DSZ05_05025 [Sulfurospirillum sp.]|nr:MAG: hypothetical protein DSZ05_05025 [Sulfurospirillum sp.]